MLPTAISPGDASDAVASAMMQWDRISGVSRHADSRLRGQTCRRPDATPIYTRHVILGIQRFEILEQLGAGAMGAVYRARDPQLEREVAIKVLLGAADGARSGLSSHRTLDLRQGAGDVSELLAEARIMARLSHPNVLPVYEVGLDGDSLFIVMELVDGGNLRAYAATPRSLPDLLSVFAQVAGARGRARSWDHPPRSQAR
jgi:serine/threonine protein kinase